MISKFFAVISFQSNPLILNDESNYLIFLWLLADYLHL